MTGSGTGGSGLARRGHGRDRQRGHGHGRAEHRDHGRDKHSEERP
jgi:hypothetical protein